MGYYLTDETVEPLRQTASIRDRACEPKTAYIGFCCMGNINQYVFCANNPVNFRDPFGLCAERDVPEGWPPKDLEWVDPGKQLEREISKMLKGVDWSMMVPAGAGIKFLKAAQASKVLNVTEDVFHQVIKKRIVKVDAAKVAEKLGATNPDIGWNEAGQIFLKNVKTGMTEATDLLIDWYKGMGR